MHEPETLNESNRPAGFVSIFCRVRRFTFAATALAIFLLLPFGVRALAAETATPSPQTSATPTPTPKPKETPTPLTFDSPETPPETAAPIYGAQVPGLRLEVFNVDGRNVKFTLYGTGELLSHMQAQLKDEDIDYFFRYNLRILSDRNVDLKGKIIYRSPKRGEEARITKISTDLHCAGLRYDSKHPRVEADKLSWLVGLQRWFPFNADQVEGFEFTVYNAYDTRQKIVYRFAKDDAITDTLLHTSLRKGGELRVRVHDGNSLSVTITDPKLRAGYKNSPDEPGAIDPFWQVRAIVNSKAWVEMIVEGQDGQDINGMDYFAGEYHRLPDDSNRYHATASAVAVKSYSVDGDRITMSMTIPEGLGINLKYLQQIAVDMNNGTVLRNNIYNVY